MPLNSLGGFQFLEWSSNQRSGAPELVREETEPINRPATDGTGVRLLGTKAPPFRMMSGVDQPSIAAAASLHQAYTALQGAPPQALVWGGVSYAALGTAYIVLEVFEPEITPLHTAAGGFFGAAGRAYLRVGWVLQPVPL